MPTLQAGESAPAKPGRLPPMNAYLDIGRAHGITWTELRREVLAILWRTGEAWSVYALADAMRSGRGAVFANSLYRILALLAHAGLVVPTASNRRFQIAPDPRQGDWGVLQCTQCEHQSLIPLASAAAAVRGVADDLGHATERLIIECVGRCRSCSSGQPSHRNQRQANGFDGPPDRRKMAHLS